MPPGRPRDTLTPKQSQAARLLAEGMSITEAAHACNLTPLRLQRWKLRPLFAAELSRQQEALKTLHQKVTEKIETTLLPAVATLEANLHHASGIVQNEAAKSLLASGGHGPINKSVVITATVNVTDQLLGRLEQVIAEAADVATRAGRLLPEPPRAR